MIVPDPSTGISHQEMAPVSETLLGEVIPDGIRHRLSEGQDFKVICDGCDVSKVDEVQDLGVIKNQHMNGRFSQPQR